MNTLMIGDKVKWVSAAGKLSGKVYNISLGKNANGDLIPWVHIQTQIEVDQKKYDHKARLCGTDRYLKMMKVKKV